MRKQASENPEVTGGLGGGQTRSAIGASGRTGASPSRRRTVPFQGPWPCRAALAGYPRRLPRPVRPRRPRQRPPAASGSELGGKHKGTSFRSELRLFRGGAAQQDIRRGYPPDQILAEDIRRKAAAGGPAARPEGPGDGRAAKRAKRAACRRRRRRLQSPLARGSGPSVAAPRCAVAHANAVSKRRRRALQSGSAPAIARGRRRHARLGERGVWAEKRRF